MTKLNSENETLKSERLCIIYYEKPKDIVFKPCSHLVACADCSKKLAVCPTCRVQINKAEKVFICWKIFVRDCQNSFSN